MATTATTKKAPTTNGKPDQRFREIQRAANLLKQFSDATRLRVILMLSEGERHVGGMSEELNQTQPAVSHHLGLLRHGGIIAPRRRGKNNFYSLTDKGEDLAKIVKGVIV